MREIKFRAYDRKDKQMVYFDSDWFIQSDEHEGIIFGGITRNHGDGDKEDFELMQYTELKDKKGKEIYEGDIVRYPSGTVVVKWLTLGMYNIAVGMDNVTDRQQNKLIKEFRQCEVIGNIYENPELLEGDIK